MMDTAQRTAAAAAPSTSSEPCSTSNTTDATASSSMYERALVHARAREYDMAAKQFEQLLTSFPQHSKGWISYAQMSKKSAGRIGPEAGAEACRSVLQRATACNPHNGQLVQAAGLLELEGGRPAAALELLQSAVQLQPSLAPVLKWKAVQEAQEALTRGTGSGTGSGARGGTRGGTGAVREVEAKAAVRSTGLGLGLGLGLAPGAAGGGASSDGCSSGA